MSCEILYSGIKKIEYAKQSELDVLRHNWPAAATTSSVALTGGASWVELPFITETASLKQPAMDYGSDVRYGYLLQFEIDGLSTNSIELINALLMQRYIVRLTDMNNNTWLLGSKKVGVKFGLSDAKVGETLPDDNVSVMKATFEDKIPILKIL
jgi:hypothetical protein